MENTPDSVHASRTDHVTRRKPTEKGRQYFIELYENQRKKLEKEILNKLDKIEKVITENSSPSIVRSELGKLDQLVYDTNYIKEKLLPLLTDEDVYTYDQWFLNIDREVVLIKSSTRRWLRENEEDCESTKSSKTSSKRSSSTKRSSSSKGSKSSKTMFLDEKVNLAALKVKLLMET